jgi:hypothetical protein
MFGNFFSENRALDELMPKNLVKPQRPQLMWRMRVLFWISKATRSLTNTRARAATPIHTHTKLRACTHTNTEIIIAFPHQQWFRKHASMHLLYWLSSFWLISLQYFVFRISSESWDRSQCLRRQSLRVHWNLSSTAQVIITLWTSVYVINITSVFTPFWLYSNIEIRCLALQY